MFGIIKKLVRHIRPTVIKEEGSEDLYSIDHIRKEALELKKIAEKQCHCEPKGNLSPYPKMARAWLFYENEPYSFRWYCPPYSNMVSFLGKLGITVDLDTAKDPNKMVEFWEKAESTLPDGVTIFEQWAAPFYK